MKKLVSYIGIGICFMGLLFTMTHMFGAVVYALFGIEIMGYNKAEAKGLSSRDIQMTESSNIDETVELKRLKEIYTKDILSAFVEQDEGNKDIDCVARYANNVENIKKLIIGYTGERHLFYDLENNIAERYNDAIGWRMVYARNQGEIFRLSTGFDFQAIAENVNIDISFYQKMNEITDSKNIDFIVFQYPDRISNDQHEVPYGASAYGDSNRKKLREKLIENGVNAIDLEPQMKEMGWDEQTGFYITDGHWNTDSAFLAARCIAKELNLQFNTQYNLDIFDSSLYDRQEYSLHNNKIDDKMTIRIPQFETDIHFIDVDQGYELEGKFEETLYDMDVLKNSNASNLLYRYCSSRLRNEKLIEINNKKNVNADAKILFIGNSFSWHVVPYLTLDSRKIWFSCPADIDNNYLVALIDDLKPDIVVWAE